ncbi:MAG: putative flavodoxin-2 [Patescibacteria group bacterium]|nr:MAG: putative flavodoxin-2 [Patescibacteria group bacterium]
MQFFIGYATYSSGTLLVSEIIENELNKVSARVVRKDIRYASKNDLKQSDVVILGSPSWWNRHKDGMPHEFMLSFMESLQGFTFPAKKFAIFGLGDTAYAKFCGAVDQLEDFVGSLKGELIVPSLRIDGFFFQQKENEKKVKEWTQKIISHINW